MLRASIRTVGEVTVVDCEGAIIYRDEATLLRKTVKDVLLKGRQVVLNLAEVHTIDSNGIGTLVGLLSSAEAAGGEVKLAALGPRVKNALTVTKLTSVFEVYPSVQDALEAFRLESTPIALAELGR